MSKPKCPHCQKRQDQIDAAVKKFQKAVREIKERQQNPRRNRNKSIGGL